MVPLEGVPGEGPRWKNVGTQDRPTLDQSIKCDKRCDWHGYIFKGNLVDAPTGPEGTFSISTLHVCEPCREPSIVTTTLSNTEAGIQVGMKILRDGDL